MVNSAVPGSSPALIAVEQLSFCYRAQEPLLREVSFSVASGELVGIIGPNGGGKTTLLRLLLGFLRPCSGSISVLGRSPTAARRALSYVPQLAQHDRLFPISVEDVVLMGLLQELGWWGRYSRAQRARVHEVLERVGLASYAQASFGSLSGGQAQRALLARALISQPQIILLDEPTASIDPVGSQALVEVIRQSAQRCAVVMVTHDMEIVQRHVDRILCVQGSVVELTPSGLCQHFSWGLYHPPGGR